MKISVIQPCVDLLQAGYQITQQRQALANNGQVVYYVEQGDSLQERQVRITQLQLEQDSGKSLHDPYDKLSLIDLNRAGLCNRNKVTLLTLELQELANMM